MSAPIDVPKSRSGSQSRKADDDGISVTPSPVFSRDVPSVLPKSKTRILLLEGVSPGARDYLIKEGFDVEYHTSALPVEELKRRIADVHIIGIRSGTKITAEVLDHASKLLAVGCFCIGTNQVDLVAAARRGVCVFNSPFCNTRSVAELIIAQLIGLSRFLGDKNRELHGGVWNKSSRNCHEIRGKTLGIVGYGHIGSQLSVLAEAMGMRVIYHDIRPKLPMGLSKQVESLEALLRGSDYVSLHVPATPLTKNMIGAKEIAMMRPGSYLLNASRGNVVVIKDLADALKSGHLRGAYADVFPSEPRGKSEGWENALRGLDNVLLTPHIGGSTEEAQANIGMDVAHKIAQYVSIGSAMAAVNFPEVDMPVVAPNSHRIANVHLNRPGVLRDINSILADYNVTRETLGTKEAIGYVIVEVDKSASAEIAEQIDALDASMLTRVLF